MNEVTVVVVVVLAYLAAAFLVWRQVYRWLYREHRTNHPSLTWDDGDRVFGITWGAVVALGWPLSGLVMSVDWLVKHRRRTGALARLLSDLEAQEDRR